MTGSSDHLAGTITASEAFFNDPAPKQLQQPRRLVGDRRLTENLDPQSRIGTRVFC